MADQAREQTDKILKKMEKRVDSIYSRAQKEISEKWDAYMKSHEEKVKSAYDDLQEAIKSGDRDAIKEARTVYERTVKNVTLNNERYKAMVNETTSKLAHTNEVALDYVNNNMAKVYTLNYNAFGNEKINGYTFTLVNEQAVKNLAKENKSLLPKKKLNVPKDKKWNTKSINSEVLQGILQGESIPKIASRLANVTDMNRKSSIRNARTMVTSAENKGRQDSFKKAESDGVIMKRRWVAAIDDRTRAWHSDLDGVEVDIDEAWSNEYGSIMYPGDPGADPANVYNCRCSIRAVVKGFNWNKSDVIDSEAEEDIKLIDGKNDPEITDSINDYYLPKDVRENLDSIKDITTYNDFKDYLKEQGITLDTDLEKLKNELSDAKIEAVEELMQKITTGIETYKSTFGDDALSSLKAVKLYDESLDTHAAYYFNLVGEKDPLAGTICFSDWNTSGRDVFHELAHAFQDSHKDKGEDIITFSNRIAKEISIPNSSYKGTGEIEGEENAEMMAEALAFGFSRGIKEDINFIEELRKIIRRKK